MGDHQAVHDGQPQAAPARVAAAGRIGAVERLEHVGQVGRPDALAVVGHLDERTPAGRGESHRHVAVGGRVAQRVRHQVGQHLAQPAGVGLDHQRRGDRVPVHRQRHAGGIGRRPVARRHLVGQVGHVDRLGQQPQVPGVGRGQLRQVLHQLLQEPHVALERAHHGHVERQDPVGHGLERAAQRGQRVAQLVGDVGHQPAPLVLVAGQRVGHGVERRCQRADLVARPHLDA